MLKKLISCLLVAAVVITVMPTEASASSWYYLGHDGAMKTGWLFYDGAWYYLQKDGAMATGKITIDGKLYEFDSNGKWISNSTLGGVTSTNTTNSGIVQDKLKAATNFSWFNDNGNTYFKVKDDVYLKGLWNIDGSVYVFDKNGIMQKGVYTTEGGDKHLFGQDGKYIKSLADDSSKLIAGSAVTTKSTSNNVSVKLDDSQMMNITDYFSRESEKGGAKPQGIKVEGKTLYCKTNQGVELGKIKVSGTDTNASLLPNLFIRHEYTNEGIVAVEINLSQEEGLLKNINPKIFAHRAGKTTVTIYVNGVKTSFDVVVTD